MQVFKIFILILTVSVVSAKDKAIVVLDASGSMWGQINGETKIAMAKTVFATMVDDWDESIEIGLTVYGHRTKGDCNDIESIYPVSAINRNKLKSIIKGISPKGKTPLSLAVQLAAKELRFTEEKATVILISDGMESCNLDPCETARELEKSGVDFTTHVIGFNVDKATSVELSCMANVTGGNYFDARNAQELTDALQQVAKFPDTISLHAINKTNQQVIDTYIEYKMTNQDSGQVYTQSTGGKNGHIIFTTDKTKAGLYPGDWLVEAQTGFYKVKQQITITEELKQQHDILFDDFTPNVEIVAQEKGAKSSMFPVSFSGDNISAGKVVLAKKGKAYVEYKDPYAYVNDTQKLKLRLPNEIGSYELQLVIDNSVIAIKDLEVIDQLISFQAVGTAAIGTQIEINLNQNKGLGGKIILDKPENPIRDYGFSYAYVTKENTLKLRLPATLGLYELRWINDRNEILYKQPLQIVAAKIEIIAPQQAPAGSAIQVKLVSPGGLDGKIILDYPEKAARDYGLSYEYADNKSEVKLRLPAKAGAYEIRWITNKNEIIARSNLNVTASEASFEAPKQAIAGTQIKVILGSTGIYGGQIVLANKSDKAVRYGISYTYVDASPALLRLTGKSGQYVIRWVSDKDELLFEQDIEIMAADIKLLSPEKVKASTEFSFKWTGPDGLSGTVVIQKPDDKPNKYGISYDYVKEDRMVKLKSPKSPGQYEIRFLSDKSELMAKSVLIVD